MEAYLDIFGTDTMFADEFCCGCSLGSIGNKTFASNLSVVEFFPKCGHHGRLELFVLAVAMFLKSVDQVSTSIVESGLCLLAHRVGDRLKM